MANARGSDLWIQNYPKSYQAKVLKGFFERFSLALHQVSPVSLDEAVSSFFDNPQNLTTTPFEELSEQLEIVISNLERSDLAEQELKDFLAALGVPTNPPDRAFFQQKPIVWVKHLSINLVRNSWRNRKDDVLDLNVPEQHDLEGRFPMLQSVFREFFGQDIDVTDPTIILSAMYNTQPDGTREFAKQAKSLANDIVAQGLTDSAAETLIERLGCEVQLQFPGNPTETSAAWLTAISSFISSKAK